MTEAAKPPVPPLQSPGGLPAVYLLCVCGLVAFEARNALGESYRPAAPNPPPYSVHTQHRTQRH